jgi:N-acetyl sugar amidotransferase
MKYCVKCLQPDTRPNIRFDENGICPACNYHDSLKSVDWEKRKSELDKIVAFGRANNSSGYDCIIGVSGGKDSMRQANFVKNVLHMNPLLVNLSYPPEQVSQRGVDNVSNMVRHGFDCISVYPAPQVWRKLMREGFFQHTNWARSTELALFSSVPRLAVAYQIPLIWWGDNGALQLGDLNILGKEGYDGNNLRKMNTLGGGEVTWLLREDVKRNQILQYLYPSEEAMDSADIRITFLGYFWKDWSLIDNGNYAALRGLEVRNEKPWLIGDAVGISALDEDWVSLNQMIKYLKYGFGKVTEYVVEDIRIGRITREQGISFVERFDGTCSDDYIESFCRYIEISTKEFWEHVDKSVNLDLFVREGLGKYTPKFKVGIGL